jgi:ribonucleoside-triphosphate reductase
MSRELAAVEKDIAETKSALEHLRGSETEVYARIVGYYRSVKNWNKGKRDEFDRRKTFSMDEKQPAKKNYALDGSAVSELFAGNAASGAEAVRYELYARKTCPNCPPVKDYLSRSSVKGSIVDVDTSDGIKKALDLHVFSAPTAVFYDAQDNLVGRAHNVRELEALLERPAARLQPLAV